MLRYFYLLSLLICINFSFCYESSQEKYLSKRSIGRIKTDDRHQRENLQHRKRRKRHDYDVYDKEPEAEIDVAKFINSAEGDSIHENDPYNFRYKKLRDGKRYNDYRSLANDISNTYEDYSDIGVENLQDAYHYNMNFDPFSEDKIINNRLRHGYDKVLQDNLDDNLLKQNKHHKEKKCVLKNIKLPFFSHNKSTTAKVKKDKKRKTHGFRNARKGNIISKGRSENRLKQDKSWNNGNLIKHDKIKKRSYIEQLCPACRRKFIISKSLRLQKERKVKNKYGSRQQHFEKNLGTKHLKNDNVDVIMPISNEKGTFENYWSDRRRKREDDDRNIERQKELEYLEKRVDSVTVNNPSCNKIKL